MLEAALNISKFTADKSFEDFQSDLVLRSAVERQIEILGEAANRVSVEFQNAHPQIPWRKVIGQRNVLAHEYKDIADNLIWAVVTGHIPELVDSLTPLVPKF